MKLSAFPAGNLPVTGAEKIVAIQGGADVLLGLSDILVLFAPLNSPGLTGSPTAPTPADLDNSTRLATTQYLDRLRGAASGIATLDGTGKLTTAQIPVALVGALQYQGTWNANTNTPTLASGVGTKGQYYKVAVFGSTSIDTTSQWNVGDLIIFDGTAWDKIDGIASEVLSVAGRTGAVSLAYADISGLSTAAQATSGTSGHTVPFLDGTNIWSGVNTYNFNVASAPTPDTGAMLHIISADGVASRFEATAFAAASIFTARRADGTGASPTALQLGDLIGAFNWHGYDGSAWSTTQQATVEAYAAANWSGTSHPTYINFSTTPVGSLTSTSRARIETDGGVTIPSTVTGGSKGVGTLNVSGAYYVGGTALQSIFTISLPLQLSGGALSINGAAGQVPNGAAGAFTPTPTLGVAGTTLGSIAFANVTSGSVTLQPVTGALGSNVLSLPAATDQLIARATTDTLTNKTYDTAGAGNVFKINGTGISAISGSGAVALVSSPAFLGVPTAPTAANSDSSTQLATTAHVKSVRLDQLAAPNASVAWNTQKITGLLDPTSAQDAATKAYVDSVAAGLAPKPSVLVATTANIALTGEQTIDGIVTSASRVLVKNQSTASQNGIYISAAGAWSRATDMAAWTQVPGAFVVVEEGTLAADTQWACTSDPGGTLGTTAITWSQFAGAGAWTAGVGINLSGTQFSLANPSASTLGGIQSAAAQSHKWINAISTSGVPSLTQPAAADLSDGVTGTGALVLATGATLVTPSLGAATATSLKTASLFPPSDGTTALQIFKADGSTRVIVVDTTNSRIGINKTPGAFDLDVNGAVNVGGALTLAGGLSAALAIGQGGTGQATAAAARASSGLNVESYTAHGDSIYTILATDKAVGTNAAFTASRTWTLPAASAVNPGQPLLVADFAGGVTVSNTLVISRAGSDTVNGGTSVTINAANGAFALYSDGVSKWSAQALGSQAASGVSSIGGASGAISVSGLASVAGSTLSVTAAVKSDQTTATSNAVAVTPGVQQYHPSAAKVWADITQSTNTINASYNVSSITHSSTGVTSISYSVAFTGGSYSGVASCQSTNLAQFEFLDLLSKASGSISVRHTSNGSAADASINYAAFGAQ